MEIAAGTLDDESAYKILTGCVVPRPIAWVTTENAAGGVNLAPFSAFTFVSSLPPMLGFNVGRRGSETKDTSRNIHAHGEYVVNIGDESMIEAIHLSAVEHPPEISETEHLGLRTIPSTLVRPQRLADAPISMEGRLHQILQFGTTGSEFFVGEVLLFHIRDDIIQAGKVDTAKLRPACRLGGPNYATLGKIITLKPIAVTRSRRPAKPAP